MVTERLATLAKEADCPDPEEAAAVLLLLYNGVLGSLLLSYGSPPRR